MTVVGVLPAEFDFPVGLGDYYTPFQSTAESARPASIALVGRLQEGVTRQIAQQEALAIGNAVTPSPTAATLRGMPVPRFEVQGLRELQVRRLQPALRVLLAAVAVLLLVVCANVANLLLVRGTARQREISVRLALGATRGRVVRQVLTECLALAMVGAILGALFGAGGITIVKELASIDAPGIFKLTLGSAILPRLPEVRVDPAVFGIAFSVSALASVAFGILPALHLSRPGPLQSTFQAAALRAGAATRNASRLRAVLVVGQLTLATILLVGAGLLIHSFSKLTSVDRGYSSANVLAFQLVFPPEYSIARKEETIESILAALRRTPAVAAAGFTRHGMLIGEQITIGTFVPEGKTLEQMGRMPVKPSLRPVSGGYLTAVGARMLDGTDVNPSDASPTPGIVISRGTAAQFGPGRQIGKLIDWHVGDRIVQLRVVGVVNDLRNTTPEREPFPEVFIDYREVLKVQQALGQPPLWQHERALGLLSFAVRTRGDPVSASPAVSRIVRDVDPRIGIDAILPLDRLVASSVARPRFYAVLLTVFAGVAGLLAAIGIYGVLAYAVVQRTQEIGVRMALGAQRAHVLAVVLRKGLILTALGIALGLAGAAGATRLLQGMLFGVAPLDPRTFIFVAVFFGAAAVLACYGPARRATMVDPIVALRSE
jgi:predicted permease